MHGGGIKSKFQLPRSNGESILEEDNQQESKLLAVYYTVCRTVTATLGMLKTVGWYTIY